MIDDFIADNYDGTLDQMTEYIKDLEKKIGETSEEGFESYLDSLSESKNDDSATEALTFTHKQKAEKYWNENKPRYESMINNALSGVVRDTISQLQDAKADILHKLRGTSDEKSTRIDSLGSKYAQCIVELNRKESQEKRNLLSKYDSMKTYQYVEGIQAAIAEIKEKDLEEAKKRLQQACDDCEKEILKLKNEEIEGNIKGNTKNINSRGNRSNNSSPDINGPAAASFSNFHIEDVLAKLCGENLGIALKARVLY